MQLLLGSPEVRAEHLWTLLPSGVQLVLPAEITHISFHRDQSGLDILCAVQICDLQVVSRIGVHVVLLEIDLGFGGFLLLG